MNLAILFFLVAIVYSLVGFGGGSSYIAFMVLFNVPYDVLPKVALVCNIIVVMGGCYHFIRKGHFNWSLFWPLIVSSIPMAFIGGRIPISKEVFLGVLGLTLVFAGGRLLMINLSGRKGSEVTSDIRLKTKVLAGGLIGFVSGLVGIGGGIFLAPLLLNLKWAKPKTVAATASMFILVNSLAGLSGQMVKSSHINEVLAYWPLFLAVFVGGQLGSRLGAGQISPAWVRGLTAVLILFVGGRLLMRLFVHL